MDLNPTSSVIKVKKTSVKQIFSMKVTNEWIYTLTPNNVLIACTGKKLVPLLYHEMQEECSLVKQH